MLIWSREEYVKALNQESSVLPYFPCQLPLIVMLTLLFVFPTYLPGVPSLGRENLPASEMGCTTSEHKSASNLGLLCVFLFSSSHELQWHNTVSALHLAVPLLQADTGFRLQAGSTKAFQGWKGWSHL